MTQTNERGAAADEQFEQVGSGQNVFRAAAPITGRAKWLDSPADVIEFIESDPNPSEVIVVARGGTTTFLSLALNAGVRGVVTLQGAPESHLGILAREYGIPCVMSVAFEKGMRTSRGEVVPGDGTQIRLDVTAMPAATVGMEAGAPVSDAPVGTGPAGPSAAEMEQIMALLANFRTEVPHGAEGDAIMRSRMTTSVLETTDDDATKILSIPEANELLEYLTWNEWDALSARATEGESGLIPRQEYEALGILNSWYGHPEWLDLIREKVGPEGLVEIGRIGRTEFGTKVNLLHCWALIAASFFGRGIGVELGLIDEHDQAERAVRAMSSARAIYHGLWGGGPIFTSARDYRADVLDDSVVQRIAGDVLPLSDADHRDHFQRLNGAAEMLCFLVHFDNRLGVGDSGPYHLPDGSRLIVRDLFLNEAAYEWADVCEGLPHALTIAMRFPADAQIDLKIIDMSTLFADPGNHLPFVDGVALYRREKWDTPFAEVTTVPFEEMDGIRDRCEKATSELYRRIAGMSHHDKLMAGMRTYTGGFFISAARAAGVLDELAADHGFWELHPDAEEALPQIGKVATELVPRLFLTGGWGIPVPEGERGEDAGETFRVVHAVAVRGFVPAEGVVASTGLDAARVEAVLDALVGSGQVRKREGRVKGYQLTPAGKTRHHALLRRDRANIDVAGLTAAYEAFLPLNGDFKQLAHDYQPGMELAPIRERLEEVHVRTGNSVEAMQASAPRFATYAERFQSAIERFRGGEVEALAKPMVESYHDVWMELHEDLLVTIGRERSEEDGS